MKRLIISRTDNIGDVILTLPVATLIKKKYPEVKILFLGKDYTEPIVNLSNSVDEFLNWTDIKNQNIDDQIRYFKSFQADVIVHIFGNKQVAEISKKAGIPLRIGNSHKIYHHFTCNKKVNFSRKKSNLHEAQLNFKLLQSIGIDVNIPLNSVHELYNFKKPEVKGHIRDLILERPGKFNVILHPKSKGSAREWGLENFTELIRLLPEDLFNIYITGTKEEAILMKNFLDENKKSIVDLTGKLDLDELIQFISITDGLIAASTGPLHIAAAMNKVAIGIFAPMRPIHPGRWRPIGKNASYMVLDKNCDDCRKTNDCKCIKAIKPEEVMRRLMQIIT